MSDNYKLSFSPKLLSIRHIFANWLRPERRPFRLKSKASGGLTCDMAKAERWPLASPPMTLIQRRNSFKGGWWWNLNASFFFLCFHLLRLFQSCLVTWNERKSWQVAKSSSLFFLLAIFIKINSPFPPPKTETKNLRNSSLFSTPPKKNQFLYPLIPYYSPQRFSAAARSFNSFSYPSSLCLA